MYPGRGVAGVAVVRPLELLHRAFDRAYACVRVCMCPCVRVHACLSSQVPLAARRPVRGQLLCDARSGCCEGGSTAGPRPHHRDHPLRQRLEAHDPLLERQLLESTCTRSPHGILLSLRSRPIVCAVTALICRPPVAGSRWENGRATTWASPRGRGAKKHTSRTHRAPETRCVLGRGEYVAVTTLRHWSHGRSGDEEAQGLGKPRTRTDTSATLRDSSGSWNSDASLPPLQLHHRVWRAL